jgi:branched-chain amino acid transport system ATP-binding protein
MTVAPLLVIENVRGGYGDITIVSDFTTTLDSGQVTCIAGRNGVGKTTLVRLVTGALMPSSGKVGLAGADVTKVPAHDRKGLGMGYAPQEGVVFDSLSVRDNLTLHHRDRSLTRYQSLFEIFPRIPERLDQRAGTLSGGEKKILSFCRAMAEDTQLVVLDEPTEGVQPENITLMAEAITRGKASGRAFLIVEQNLGLVEAVADTACLLDHGECIYTTTETGPQMRSQLSTRMQI